jgi:ribosomal 30S subunit maturation factor RimM
MDQDGIASDRRTHPSSPELMVVGRLVGAQGLEGELRVLSLSDFHERFTQPGRRWLRSGPNAAQPIDLIRGKEIPGKKSLFAVRIKGVNTRDAAEALVGTELLVPTSDRPPCKTRRIPSARSAGTAGTSAVREGAARRDFLLEPSPI